MSVFLVGFAKSERANIEKDELEGLKGQARVLLGLSGEQLDAALAADELLEVDYDEEE